MSFEKEVNGILQHVVAYIVAAFLGTVGGGIMFFFFYILFDNYFLGVTMGIIAWLAVFYSIAKLIRERI